MERHHRFSAICFRPIQKISLSYKDVSGQESNINGCGNILGINCFLFWESFFLWFQLEVETFKVGVGCPCRGGLEKKQLEGGWGERAQHLNKMHSQNILRASPAVHRIVVA